MYLRRDSHNPSPRRIVDAITVIPPTILRDSASARADVKIGRYIGEDLVGSNE
jgi:hypothetical protein